MKKTLSVFLVLSMLFAASAALAEGMGVQVIGGQDPLANPVSLDDVQIDTTIEVPGWGDITPTRYYVQDCVMVRKPGQLGTIWMWKNEGSNRPEGYDKSIEHNLKVTCKPHSREEYPYWAEEWVTHYFTKSQADYAILNINILNTTAAKKDYLKGCSVKVVLDDTIEYAGWYYQQDYDLDNPDWIDNADNFEIGPYYVGHYVFGCTLPNAAFTSDKPLRMEITLDGNEIIYNIRK